MQENAVKQRVRLLEALWEEESRQPGREHMRLACMMGTGTVDYRMIKGFVMVQMTVEAGLPDVFLCSHHPFRSPENYGRQLVNGMKDYIDAWNQHALSDEHGKVEWSPEGDEQDADEVYFTRNLNKLAESLQVTGEGEDYLVMALMPEPNYAPTEFVKWLDAILKAGVSGKVRLLVFDLYGSHLYEGLEKSYKDIFVRLYPDLDMPGAMSQIAEQAMVTAVRPEDKAIASFQKNLLELNKAIGRGEERDIELYRDECLRIAIQQQWPHMEAVVHFFTHGYFMATEKYERAATEIDQAISRADVAVAEAKIEDKALIVQYRITKANMFLLREKYEEAENGYAECIEKYRDSGDNVVLTGIHQMMGMCQRKQGKVKAARKTFADGWLLVKDDKAYVDGNAMSRFYAQQMMKAGMDRIAEYRDWFEDLEKRWGKRWYMQMPDGKQSMKKREQQIFDDALLVDQ
ncbi:hypothetical protein [Terrimonas ferruginea]|uniref:hypothetical protein n=1 Tax=Terrimonas ferruginea TaxID=249 RepID=UPI0004098357|nr:hypothetical protein [Terrimonas ferruginea]